MKIIKPSQYCWIFTLAVHNKDVLPVLKLLEVDAIGYDQENEEWIFFDNEGNEYLASECVEVDYQPIEEKLDI